MKFIPTGATSPGTVIKVFGIPGGMARTTSSEEEDEEGSGRGSGGGEIPELKVYPFKVSLVPAAAASSRTWRGCVRALLRQLKACPRCRAAGREFPVHEFPRKAQLCKLPSRSDHGRHDGDGESWQLCSRDSDGGGCAQASRCCARGLVEAVEEYDLVSIDPNCPRHGKYSLTAWLRKRGDSPKKPSWSRDFNNAAATAAGQKLNLKKKVAENYGRKCVERVKPAARRVHGNDPRRECPGETYSSQYRRMCQFKSRRFSQNCNVEAQEGFSGFAPPEPCPQAMEALRTLGCGEAQEPEGAAGSGRINAMEKEEEEGDADEAAPSSHMCDLKEREPTRVVRRESVHSTRMGLLGDRELSPAPSDGEVNTTPTELKEQRKGSEMICETQEVFEEGERRTIEQAMEAVDGMGQPSTSTLKRCAVSAHRQMESYMFDMSELENTSQRLERIAHSARALQMELKGNDGLQREPFVPIEKVRLAKVELGHGKEERDYWPCNMAIERARNRVSETCDGGRVCQLVQAFESIK